ncbi:MAG: radical SAM protein, partial [Planctomycetota bacterium]
DDAERSASEVLADLPRYANFLRAAGGGFTVSGGEPLVQAPFAMRLLRGAKRFGLHTALDTNGYLGGKLDDQDFESIDLVLLDLKAFDAARHRRLTGMGNEHVLAFAERLASLDQPAWVRFVLVPGVTDDPQDVRDLARFVAGLPNVERLEVLPFHQMGRRKWRDLGLKYSLDDTPAATPAEVDAARAVFQRAGCAVA